jgi:hypothetical protein
MDGKLVGLCCMHGSWGDRALVNCKVKAGKTGLGLCEMRHGAGGKRPVTAMTRR